MKKYVPLLIILLALVGCSEPISEENATIPVETPAAVPVESQISTPIPSPTEEADMPVYPDPITGFFASCRFEPGVQCTPFDSYFSSLEAEAWKREAEHAFQILKENAHPDIKKLGIDIEQMEADLHAFVDAQSELYAYICFTSALGGEGGEWGETIFRGTGFSQGHELARAAIYKTFVKDFYACGLHYPKGGESYVSDYVFDPDEVLAELEAFNIACTVEPYEIEIPLFAWSALENPIDAWVEDSGLYSDGSTLALSCDAHMEADIWKSELEHLYSILQERSNPIAELEPLIQAAQEAYFSFVPAFGEVESLYAHSGLFMPELWKDDVSEHEDRCGTIHYSERWINQTYYFREEVFRLRQALCGRLGEEAVDWAFDPAPYEAEMKEFYGEDWGEPQS